jgi:hypothetical protein
LRLLTIMGFSFGPAGTRHPSVSIVYDFRDMLVISVLVYMMSVVRKWRSCMYSVNWKVSSSGMDPFAELMSTI